MLHLAAKAFWPAPVPFPVLHVDTGPQLPRGARLPRRAPSSGSGCGSRSPACRTTSTTAGCASAPTAPATRCRPMPLLDAIAEHRFDARLRRRPARRGEGPRQGARSSPCATSSASGTREPAPRAVEPLQPAAPARRARPRLPASATGPSSTSGATSSARTSRCPALLRPRARGVPARRHVARGRPGDASPRDGRDVETRLGALPHRRRHVLHRGRRVRRRARSPTSSSRSAASTLTERGATRADDRISEAAMEDRKKEGYF